MDEVNRSICNGIASGAEGRLTDRRDGKIYWVGKLKDGLCWMTQNLDYDGGGTKTSSFSTDNNTAQYYDPGNYIYTAPTSYRGCGVQSTSKGLAVCMGKDWKSESIASNADVATLTDVSDWTSTDDIYFIYSTSYTGTDGGTICSKDAGSMIGSDLYYPQCKVYYYSYKYAYLHYLAGNYYSWQAATNGTGAAAKTDGTEASGSVCPTGWKLPLSGSSTNGTNGSFYNVLNGLDRSTVAIKPYYYVPGGYISEGTFVQLGTYGYYWNTITTTPVKRRWLFIDTSQSLCDLSRAEHEFVRSSRRSHHAQSAKINNLKNTTIARMTT